MIIQDVTPIKELRQCVHSTLPSLFIFPISVGSVPLSWLNGRSSQPFKGESHKT